jgi:hypothetical protein
MHNHHNINSMDNIGNMNNIHKIAIYENNKLVKSQQSIKLQSLTKKQIIL